MFKYFIVFIFAPEIILCDNILGVIPLASHSHYLWHRPYYLELVKNGHNVTVLGHDTEIEKISGYTVIVMEGVYEKLRQNYSLESLFDMGPFTKIKFLWDWDDLSCAYDLETNGLRELLNYPKNFKFDLIIWDMNSAMCLYPLIDRFGSPPVIGTSPFGLHSHVIYPFGSALSSFVPFYQLLTIDRHMNFWNRLLNYIYIHVLNLSRLNRAVPSQFELAKNFFGDKIRSFYEVEQNIHLLLANYDPVFDYVQYLPPNIIPVGGIHIENAKPLPLDLQTILDNAKHGAILVIFGTNLNWKKISTEKRQAFFKAFEKLSQTILIKMPSDRIVFPKNVIAKDWLPQNDILAHPNVKLFLTHGGALSTHEAMYHGVPMIGMPFYLDQHGNTAKIEGRLLGKKFNFHEINYDLVYETIREVIENPMYKINMKELSGRYHDQAQKPMEKAIFWTEYVLRHGTAEHLSPASRYMSIYQRFDLDILGIFLGLFVIVMITVYSCLKCLTSLFPQRKNKFKQS